MNKPVWIILIFFVVPLLLTASLFNLPNSRRVDFSESLYGGKINDLSNKLTELDIFPLFGGTVPPFLFKIKLFSKFNLCLANFNRVTAKNSGGLGNMVVKLLDQNNSIVTELSPMQNKIACIPVYVSDLKDMYTKDGRLIRSSVTETKINSTSLQMSVNPMVDKSYSRFYLRNNDLAWMLKLIFMHVIFAAIVIYTKSIIKFLD